MSIAATAEIAGHVEDRAGCDVEPRGFGRSFLVVALVIFASATSGYSQERVIKDEPGPTVHRTDDVGPVTDGHDLPEIEQNRWGTRETWELAIGLTAVSGLLIFAFLRWQARAERRG